MKIALTVDPEIPVPPVLYGGIERIVDMLALGLIEEGHDVTLFAHPGSNVNCRLIPWKGKASQNIADTIRNAKTLFHYARKEKFDIVHSFSRLAYLLPMLPLKIPKVMSYQREPSLKQISKVLRITNSGSLMFTGCSNYITDKIKTVAKATTVYNGVVLEKYSPVYFVNFDAPLVFLGRIESIKGPHLAIDVAIKVGKKLIIAGNIPEDGKEYFEKKIKPFLNESISYIGPVNDEQKSILLSHACGFLMPVLWNEPFGIVMAEAMACGTPLIGFPLGAIPEVIKDGINGFVCTDVESMVTAVQQLDKINRKMVRQIAEENFSSKVIVRKYIEIYSSIK